MDRQVSEGRTAHDPLESLRELAGLLRPERPLYVRYSKGFEHDSQESSRDGESGLELPGLSANPLDPEPWWTRPVQDWLARQLCQYQHLRETDPERHAWILAGRCIGRGPDCEPLLTEVEHIADVSAILLKEAQERYDERFHAGRQPH